MSDLATDGGGNWIVVWNGPGGLLASRSTDDGLSWQAAVVIDPLGTGARLATDALGHWFVAYEKQVGLFGLPATDVFVSRSNDLGATWVNVTSLSVSDFDQQAQLAILDGARLMCVWQVASRGRFVPLSMGAYAAYANTDGTYARSVDAGASWSEPRAFYAGAAPDDRIDQLAGLVSGANGTTLAVWNALRIENNQLVAMDAYLARSVNLGNTAAGPWWLTCE